VDKGRKDYTIHESRKVEMKKVIFLVVLLSLCFGGVVFAQQTSRTFSESEFYYVNVGIERIFVYRLGYVVLYRRGPTDMARVYIPHEWFTVPGGRRGEMIYLGSGSEWPSMTVYYNQGEFSHVRLRVRQNRSHETWGVVPLNVNIDDRFRDVQELLLQF
jgi:hypothetical protein